VVLKYEEILHIYNTHTLCVRSRDLTDDTGWRGVIGCLNLHVIFRKRATNYRAVLRETTYEDQAHYDSTPPCTYSLCKHAYGVAIMSRLPGIIGLFCKRTLRKRLYSAKETYNLKEPTNRSHPIFQLRYATHCTTLQHTATYCNILHRTASHRNTLALHCITLQKFHTAHSNVHTRTHTHTHSHVHTYTHTHTPHVLAALICRKHVTHTHAQTHTHILHPRCPELSHTRHFRNGFAGSPDLF